MYKEVECVKFILLYKKIKVIKNKFCHKCNRKCIYSLKSNLCKFYILVLLRASVRWLLNWIILYNVEHSVRSITRNFSVKQSPFVSSVACRPSNIVRYYLLHATQSRRRETSQSSHTYASFCCCVLSDLSSVTFVYIRHYITLLLSTLLEIRACFLVNDY